MVKKPVILFICVMSLCFFLPSCATYKQIDIPSVKRLEENMKQHYPQVESIKTEYWKGPDAFQITVYMRQLDEQIVLTIMGELQKVMQGDEFLQDIHVEEEDRGARVSVFFKIHSFTQRNWYVFDGFYYDEITFQPGVTPVIDRYATWTGGHYSIDQGTAEEYSDPVKAYSEKDFLLLEDTAAD